MQKNTEKINQLKAILSREEIKIRCGIKNANLKINSEKMVSELNDRKDKIKLEISENQKNPERIATSKGQNLQNLENIKRRNKEIETELLDAENKFSAINENLREIQLKLTELKENKARNEATIEGIENRKKDLLYSLKNELGIESETSILPQSDLRELK